MKIETTLLLLRKKTDLCYRNIASIPLACTPLTSVFFRPSSRHVTFRKGKNVGIRLAGGNDVGIFVASVQEGSPAARQGLKMGDKILSVNESSFRNMVREDAVVTLMGLPVGEDVRIVAQAQPDGEWGNRGCVGGAIHPLHGESGGQMGGELGQFTQIAVSEKTNRWGVPVVLGRGNRPKTR